jgi:hypothetical protein
LFKGEVVKQSKPHPLYDCAYRFLEEDNELRLCLAKDLVDLDYLKPGQSRPYQCRRRVLVRRDNDNQSFYEGPPEMKTREEVIEHGNEAHGSWLHKDNDNHPSKLSGIYSTPLIFNYLTFFKYWQFGNDPMHINSNCMDGVTCSLGEHPGPFLLSKDLRIFFDRLGSSLKMPSQYSIPNYIIQKDSNTKSGDKFTLCSEIFIFLYSSTVTRVCPGYHNRMAALFGFVLCLHRTMCSSHTQASLDELQRDIVYFITVLQLYDPNKTFSFINFHLSNIFS